MNRINKLFLLTMKNLLETIAQISGLPTYKIKGKRRYGRNVSQAKMIFCMLAYENYRMMPPHIAIFLECPRENVYYLLQSAKNKLDYDKEFRELYSIVKQEYFKDNRNIQAKY